MTAHELEAVLHARFPLAAFMQVSVVSLQPNQVELGAPLEPNVNVHGTLFGGSAASLALLAAWSLAHLRVAQEGLSATLVVRSHHMTYLRPVTGRVAAVATFGDTLPWAAFVEQARSEGRGRIDVVARIRSGGLDCARLSAEFAIGRAH